MKRTLIQTVLYLTYIVVIILLVWYGMFVFYRYKVFSSATGDTKKVEHLISDEMIRKVGFIPNRRSSSFLNYNKAKPEGIFRIGVFGDSFTNGSEVKDGYDYPALLEKELRSSGYLNVEVLNFGVGFHGFTQSYLIWEAYAGIYELDCIVVGPTAFREEREQTFNHAFVLYNAMGRTAGRYELEYFRARFIVENSDLKLKELPGATREEQLKTYWNFIPSFESLKYDKFAPVSLAAPLSLIKKRKLIRNPFYYRSDIEEEQIFIWKKLLAKTASKRYPVFVIDYDSKKIQSLKDKMIDNLFLDSIAEYRSFLDLVLDTHNSAYSNSLIAKQLKGYLTGETKVVFERLLVENSEKSYSLKSEIELNNLKRISFKIGESEYANMYNTEINYFRDCCSNYECEPKDSIFEIKGKTLIGFSGIDSFFLDQPIISLDYDIDQKPLVELKSLFKKHSLDVEKVIEGFPLWVVKGHRYYYTFYENTFAFYNKYGFKKFENVYLEIDGKKIMKGRVDTKGDMIIFEQLKGYMYKAASDGRRLLDIEKLSDQGQLIMKLYVKNGRDKELPLGLWKKSLNEKIFLEKRKNIFKDKKDDEM